MNRITLHGTVCKNAEMFDVYGDKAAVPVVSFVVKDYGKPGSPSIEPLTMQVHFRKDVGISILPDLVRGREVNVYGSIVQKSFVTSTNEFRTKVYMIADYIEFIGKGFGTRETAA